ncbi:MAG: ATP-binding cassette domain-containing protein, partial [Oscillospiraceae bacterium]
TEGLFLPQSIVNNITVSKLEDMCLKVGVLDSKKIEAESLQWVENIGIMTSDHKLPVQTLSGGNQQKVVLARWLATKPKILILNGPTVGVDIGAKYDIHNLLKKLASQGMAIIVVSDDAGEILSTCDKAIVMQGGVITEQLEGTGLNKNALLAASN